MSDGDRGRALLGVEVISNVDSQQSAVGSVAWLNGRRPIILAPSRPRAGTVNELKERQLRFILLGAGEANAKADQADRFACARERFGEQGAKLLESRQ